MHYAWSQYREAAKMSFFSGPHLREGLREDILFFTFGENNVRTTQLGPVCVIKH